MQCHLILSRNVSFEKPIPPVRSEDKLSGNNHESHMLAHSDADILQEPHKANIITLSVQMRKMRLRQHQGVWGKGSGPPDWNTAFVLKVVEAERAGGFVLEREVALRGSKGGSGGRTCPHRTPTA